MLLLSLESKIAYTCKFFYIVKSHIQGRSQEFLSGWAQVIDGNPLWSSVGIILRTLELLGLALHELSCNAYKKSTVHFESLEK